MNTAAWEALLSGRYAEPSIPASLGQARHSGGELDLVFGLGCLRFHRRAPLKASRSVLYTLIPLRILPTLSGARAPSSLGLLAAQLVRLAATTVGDFSAQTVVLDTVGVGEEALAAVCAHVYEAIRAMHASYAPGWRDTARRLSTLYLLGGQATVLRIYTTTVVHEPNATSFLDTHRMFSLSAETATGTTLRDAILAAERVPCSTLLREGDVDPHAMKGALLRMVSVVEEAISGEAALEAANRAAARTAIKAIVLEQSLGAGWGDGGEAGEAEKAEETPSPSFDSLLLGRLLIEPNYIPRLTGAGRDVISLRQILGAFAVAAQAPPTTPLFEAEGDLVYRGRDTLGVLSGVARMGVVLLNSGVEAPLCAAYLATPLPVIRELEGMNRTLPTPKDIGTVGIESAGLLNETDAAGIEGEPALDHQRARTKKAKK